MPLWSAEWKRSGVHRGIDPITQTAHINEEVSTFEWRAPKPA